MMQPHRRRRFVFILLGAAIFLYAAVTIVMTTNSKSSTQVLSPFDGMDQETLVARISSLKGSEDRWKNAKIWVSAVAAVLAVLVGVFEVLENRAESEHEVAQERLSSLLREASNAEIALTRRQASDANERATGAEVRAAEAIKQAADATLLARRYEADIATSNARAAEAQSMAKSFEADIAKANQSAAEANVVAEKERIARLQLELRLAPRTISTQHSQQLISALREFSGVKVDVIAWGNVPEIERITRTLADNLSKAGWEIGHFGIAMGGAGTVQGIVVGARSDAGQRVEKAASALVPALRSIGLDAAPWDFDQMPFPGSSVGNGIPTGAPIKLFVGNKP